MKFAGIIAEYDPFHNGHAWQLAQAKALGTSPCVLHKTYTTIFLVSPSP